MKNARLASVARRALSLPGRALDWELLAAPAPVVAAILTLVAAALRAALLVAGDLAGTDWSEGSESCGHWGISFPVSDHFGDVRRMSVSLPATASPAIAHSGDSQRVSFTRPSCRIAHNETGPVVS
jgi:hypothetical protein